MFNSIFVNLRCKINKQLRNYCYKPVKRADIFSKTEKLKEKSKINQRKQNSQEITSLNLSKHLYSKILATGPITVADYMKEVLINPSTGYYMNRDVFGVGGDFITSPEINQIFGELIAIWCLNEWQKIGSPNPFKIIELGPGRGTLSRDILRVFSHFRLANQLSLHLIEISPYLSQIQAQKLCFKHEEVNNEIDNDDNDNNKSKSLYYRKGETVTGIKIYWYYKLDDVPKNDFSIILAHEFFDVLPIHKLQYENNEWKEILIDIDNKNSNNNNNDNYKFRMILSNKQTPISKIFKLLPNDERKCLEYSIECKNILKQMIERFENDGGFSLIIDYGHFGDKTDTFRAFKNHKLCDPLINPGTADLTADVDFKMLKTIAEENNRMITFGPVEQGIFLKRMEAEARLKVLLDNCLPENEEQIKSSYDMLINPNKMGSRYKFFAIFPSALKDHLKKFPVCGFSEK